MNHYVQYSGSTLLVMITLLISNPSSASSTRYIYGLDDVCGLHIHKKMPITVQVGAFKLKKNASQLKTKLLASIQAPVHIITTHSFYRVIIGPIEPSSARSMACSLLSKKAMPHSSSMKMIQHEKTSLMPQVNPVTHSGIQPDTHTDNKGTQHDTVVYGMGEIKALIASMGPVELSGALGGSMYSANNAFIQVSSVERDLDQVSRTSSNMLYSVGLGYHAFSKQLEKRHFLTGLLGQLNYYYSSSTVNGNVWAFQSPNSINYSFQAPMRTSRLMIDIKPEFFVYKGFTPYGVVGAGVAWSNMSYHESPFPDNSPLGAVSLQHHTNTTAAWDLGLGVSRPITENLNMSIEYLYTALGTLLPSVNATSQQTIVGAPGFSMQGQSVMARLSWRNK